MSSPQARNFAVVGLPALFALVLAGRAPEPLKPESKSVKDILLSGQLKEEGAWVFTVQKHTSIKEVCDGRCQTEGVGFAIMKGGQSLQDFVHENLDDIEDLREDMRESSPLDSVTNVEDSPTGEVQFSDSDAAKSGIGSDLEAPANGSNSSDPESPFRQIRGFSLPTALSQNFSWGLDYIGSYKKVLNGGKGVNIYVLSTGIRRSHTEFGGRAIAQLDLTRNHVWTCGGESACSDDFDGHGTHMAGVAGGTTFGVAPQATLHAIKVSTAFSRAPGSNGLVGIEYVANQGLRPAVALWNYQFEFDDPIFSKAMAAANDAGVIIAVGAGNEGVDVCRNLWGSAIPAIKVAATTRWNAPFPHGNFGSCIDLLAPGTDIKGPSHTSQFSVLKRSGTSIAASFAAGAAALLLEADPTLTYQKVVDRLRESSLSGRVPELHGLPDRFLNINQDPDLLSVLSDVPVPKCPDFAVMQEADVDGDCFCHWGEFCSRDGTNLDCPTSDASEVGGLGGYIFKWTCTDCRCHKIPQSGMAPAEETVTEEWEA